MRGLFSSTVEAEDASKLSEREQTLPRCPNKLAQRLLNSRRKRTLRRLQGRDDLAGEYLLHGGSSCLDGLQTPVTVTARPDKAGGPPFKVLRDLGQPPGPPRRTDRSLPQLCGNTPVRCASALAVGLASFDPGIAPAKVWSRDIQPRRRYLAGIKRPLLHPANAAPQRAKPSQKVFHPATARKTAIPTLGNPESRQGHRSHT